LNLRVGLDLIEIDRVRRALERHGDGFRARCFTRAERDYCDGKANPAQHYAGRFAAKEAVGKALGTGVHFTWKEIEIRGRPKPGVFLSGRTARAAERLGAGKIELSMTHSRELAAAVAVITNLRSEIPNTGVPLATQTDARANADGHAGKAGMASTGIASDASAARPESGTDKRHRT
jgi:holo-[acyl-carrier protein] synthase